MSINLTDEIEVKTKKGKLGAAKQIFLEGDTQTVEKEIQDINSRHNTLNTKHESLSRTVQGIAATGGANTATNVTYNNDASGLNAENAQDAIDEVSSIAHFAKKGGVVNISTNYNSDHIVEVLTLSQALSKVPMTDRVLGFQGKYLATDGWHTIIYTGNSLTDWGDTTKWTDLADKVFNSISKNATFAGIATPTTNPGKPDGPVFYIATTSGSYSNFNNIEVLKGETVILQWNSGTWAKSAFKPMTDFNSVFDDNGNSLTHKLNTLDSNISELEGEIYGVVLTVKIDFVEGTKSWMAEQQIDIPSGTYNISFDGWDTFTSGFSVYLTDISGTEKSYTINQILNQNTFEKQIVKISFHSTSVALKTGTGLLKFADINTLSIREELNNHILNNDNPHNVTAEQIGLGTVLTSIQSINTSIESLNDSTKALNYKDKEILNDIVKIDTQINGFEGYEKEYEQSSGVITLDKIVQAGITISVTRPTSGTIYLRKEDGSGAKFLFNSTEYTESVTTTMQGTPLVLVDDVHKIATHSASSFTIKVFGEHENNITKKIEVLKDEIEKLNVDINGSSVEETVNVECVSGSTSWRGKQTLSLKAGTYSVSEDISNYVGEAYSIYLHKADGSEYTYTRNSIIRGITLEEDVIAISFHGTVTASGTGHIVFIGEESTLGIKDDIIEINQKIEEINYKIAPKIYQQVVESGNGSVMSIDFDESEPIAIQVINAAGEIESNQDSSTTIYITDSDNVVSSTTMRAFFPRFPFYGNDGWIYFVKPKKRIKSISFYGLGNTDKYPYTIKIKNGENENGYWTQRSDTKFIHIDKFGYDLLPKYYWEDCWIHNKIEAIKSYLTTCASNADVFFFTTDMHWNYGRESLTTDKNPFGIINALQSPKLIKYISHKLGINTILDGGDRVHNGTDDAECRTLRQQLEDAIGCKNVFVTYGNHEFLHRENTFDEAFSALRTPNYNVVYGDVDRSYFYVDNRASKMRYISMCANGPWKEGTDKTEHYPKNEDQIAWLESVMNVEEGWNIVIFAHYFYTIMDDTDRIYPIQGTQPVIDAITQNNRNNQVAVVLSGHTHCDRMHKNEADNFTYVICQADEFGTSMAQTYNETYLPYGDIKTPREYGTTTEQHFEVVVINKKDREVKLFPIGSPSLNGYDDNKGTEVDVRTVSF